MIVPRTLAASVCAVMSTRGFDILSCVCEYVDEGVCVGRVVFGVGVLLMPSHVGAHNCGDYEYVGICCPDAAPPPPPPLPPSTAPAPPPPAPYRPAQDFVSLPPPPSPSVDSPPSSISTPVAAPAPPPTAADCDLTCMIASVIPPRLPWHAAPKINVFDRLVSTEPVCAGIRGCGSMHKHIDPPAHPIPAPARVF